SGEAYAGFVTFVDYAANAREYLACQLIEPLEVGEDYYIRFAISTIDGDGQSYCKCATDRLGAKFFKDPTYGINQGQTPYTPQNNADIEHNEFISDTANWILIEGW